MARGAKEMARGANETARGAKEMARGAKEMEGNGWRSKEMLQNFKPLGKKQHFWRGPR